uniref:glutamine amidotransferase-like class 1 domain-containing protein 3A, mitochondrial isoform X3 n=1 Tax=Podarcis muralis TaxID=64176 RepID=UPI0010A097E6|nr:glutamine amidotransferase-like class 1 domain-containing protein 3A, mitochondrial isoform X3 [Podarcis muralis]
MLAARLAGCRPPLSSLRVLRGLPAAGFHCSAQRLRGARVAVVLSGCGVYDGTEIHEASAILVHLSREGASVQMYAPDISQMHVIDHSKGQPAEGESRNVLAESARIARGKIADLAKLTAKDHDAVIFPGGFGAAKNLSTFAVDGKDCKVNGEVERVLKDFNKAGKPIGILGSCHKEQKSVMGWNCLTLSPLGVFPLKSVFPLLSAVCEETAGEGIILRVCAAFHPFWLQRFFLVLKSLWDMKKKKVVSGLMLELLGPLKHWVENTILKK